MQFDKDKRGDINQDFVPTFRLHLHDNGFKWKRLSFTFLKNSTHSFSNVVKTICTHTDKKKT